MIARYLLRLDDACPTCHTDRWARLEELLDKHGIRPMVAIVPDNRDDDLKVSPEDKDFWHKAVSWQDKGWTLGLHGFQHLLRPVSTPQYLDFHRQSEFVGLPFQVQADKIELGWQILRQRGLRPTVWVAPAHSFDTLTLEALRDRTDIRLVSDGIARDAYQLDGFYWLPQQLWSLTRKSSGLWTVCLHPNSLDDADFGNLSDAIQQFRTHIISVDDVVLHQRSKTAEDKIETGLYWARHYIGKVRARLGSLRRSFP
jgi:predicted deacetylase